jgi:hypothetical protein
MSKEDFDELMDSWVDHESKRAPELRPSEEMYRMVEAQGEQGFGSFASQHWLTAGIALACLVILAIAYNSLVTPFYPPQVPPAKVVALVALRTDDSHHRGATAVELPEKGGKGPEVTSDFFNYLTLQIHTPGSVTAKDINLLQQPAGTITLTPENDYSLILAVAQDAYLYIFQSNPAFGITKLFPEEDFNPALNPLRTGEAIELPSEPYWFYLKAVGGQNTLFILAAEEYQGDLEEYYTRYRLADDEAEQITLADNALHLIEQLPTLQPGEVELWTFRFDSKETN